MLASHRRLRHSAALKFLFAAVAGLNPAEPPNPPRSALPSRGQLDLPRFRGEMRAWDQALWLYVMLSSGSWHSLVRPPAEPFFRPDPCTDAAAARSGGQGRPLSAAARRACP